MNLLDGILFRIGKCLRCLRIAGVSAIIAWGITLASSYVGLAYYLLPAAIALSVLWLWHVAIFLNDRGLELREGRNLGRRGVITGMAAVAAAGMMVSFAPRKALAERYIDCPATHCGRNFSCPGGYQFLSMCNCKCYEDAPRDCDYVLCPGGRD